MPTPTPTVWLRETIKILKTLCSTTTIMILRLNIFNHKRRRNQAGEKHWHNCNNHASEPQQYNIIHTHTPLKFRWARLLPC